MKKARTFYQDFVFEEIPLDDMEYPNIMLKHGDIDKPDHTVCLSNLMAVTSKTEWDKILSSVNSKRVVLMDDIPIENAEVDPYKQFFLKAYYYWISKQAAECFVYCDNHVSRSR